MKARHRDGLRLTALALCLVPAIVLGRDRPVDVENLSMKSVGTTTEAAAQRRAQEFGDAPRLVLWAAPLDDGRAGGADPAPLERWVEGLRARTEVASLESLPVGHHGERWIGLDIRRDGERRYAAGVRALEEAARRTLPATHRLTLAGYPVVEIAIAEALEAERLRILPLVIAALGALLWLVYRSPVLALGALLAPLSGVLLLEGLQGALGLAVDPISALLGPAVLSVGVASSVHVLEAYRRALHVDRNVERATRLAAARLRVPFALAVATTVTGFLGLMASPIPAVRRFGVLAAVGVTLAMGTTYLCLPGLLRIAHRPVATTSRAPRRPRLRPARYAARLTGARGVVLVLAAGTAVVAGLVHAPRARMDNDPLHVLPAEHAVRRDATRLARRLGGTAVFELLLPPGGPSGPLALASLVAQVGALDGVVGPAGTPRVSANGHTLLPFLLATEGAHRQETVFAPAESIALRCGWEEAVATGLAVQVERDSLALVNGQRQGIALTLLGLWIVMALGFRSARLGLLGLVPNVLPVILIQGTMGAWNQPMTVATSMIAVVMLGLVVDDTIHLLHVYRIQRRRGLRPMARTLGHVSRPVLITTAVLCLGFAATLSGELDATREFGRLAVATLLIALVADLVLLPALLLLRGGRTRFAEDRA